MLSREAFVVLLQHWFPTYPCGFAAPIISSFFCKSPWNPYELVSHMYTAAGVDALAADFPSRTSRCPASASRDSDLAAGRCCKRPDTLPAVVPITHGR